MPEPETTILAHALDRLEIPRAIHDQMVEHSLRDAPRECCGLLAGKPQRATSLHPLRNADPASELRYDADPMELITAIRAIREARAEIVAIYHSHPQTEAVPSSVDLRENHWGPVPRIIVSLAGQSPVVRVWRLEPKTYHEIPWRLV